MSGYKNLDVWNVSMQIVKEVYLLARKFPKEELYALTSQCKRAAVSIPANIAEGLGRHIKKIHYSSCIFPEDLFMNWKLY